MRRSGRWIALFGAVAAVELFVRFALPFDLERVLIVETVLFLGASFASFALARRAPKAEGWRHVLQLTLAGSFILAAIRVGLWAAGQPVARANLVIAILGAMVVTLTWWSRRRTSRVPGPIG